jgi:serine/threonine-protein kinase
MAASARRSKARGIENRLHARLAGEVPTSSAPRAYRIVRLLGHGGMAQVFEAVAAGEGGFERRVALKQILADHHGDASVLRSFFDEARLAGQLHHGGIVSVLDYGVAEGVPFQVLEYVDGLDARTLAESGRARGRPMPTILALHLCREVAHALHYAHAATDAAGAPLGLVHRDVKPANILVSWSGDVKLGDFGVAFASVRTEQTLDGVAKGTPAYMSPEQGRGDDVDGRADVFSLGCVLHALLTGKSPIATQAGMLQILSGQDPALSPDLPEDARDVVEEATRADRERRFRTAGQMAEALGEIIARRSARDVKTELLAWLASVRPDAAPASLAPAPGARGARLLDALLGAELFLDDAREATVRPVENATRRDDAAPPPLRAEATVRLPAPIALGTPAPAVPEQAPPRRVPRATLAVALAMLTAGLAVAARGFVAPESAAVAPQASVAAPPPSAAAPAPSAAEPSAAPTPVGSPPEKASAAPPPPRSPARPLPAPSSADPPAAPAAPAASAPVLPAVLAVGGPVGATVIIDGAPRGLTPKYLQLTAGTHRIEVIGRDGVSLGTGVIKLQPDHTASAPLRWSPPARP